MTVLGKWVAGNTFGEVKESPIRNQCVMSSRRMWVRQRNRMRKRMCTWKNLSALVPNPNH